MQEARRMILTQRRRERRVVSSRFASQVHCDTKAPSILICSLARSRSEPTPEQPLRPQRLSVSALKIKRMI